MEEKKKAIITIRTTEQLKSDLEEEAARRGWTLSQLAESILSETIDEYDLREEETIKTILNLIDAGTLKNMKDIARWSIQNKKWRDIQRAGYILSLVTNEAPDDALPTIPTKL